MGDYNKIKFNKPNLDEQHFDISYVNNSDSALLNKKTRYLSPVGICAVGLALTFSCTGINGGTQNLDRISNKLFYEMPAYNNENFDYRVNFLNLESYNDSRSNYGSDVSMKTVESVQKSIDPIKKKITKFVDDEVLSEEIIARTNIPKKVGTIPIITKGKRVSKFEMEV